MLLLDGPKLIFPINSWEKSTSATWFHLFKTETLVFQFFKDSVFQGLPIPIQPIFIDPQIDSQAHCLNGKTTISWHKLPPL